MNLLLRLGQKTLILRIFESKDHKNVHMSMHIVMFCGRHYLTTIQSIKWALDNGFDQNFMHLEPWILLIYAKMSSFLGKKSFFSEY